MPRRPPGAITVIVAPSPRLLGTREAAIFLGISERALEARRWDLSFPEPIKFGRRNLWDRKILDQWVDAVSGIDEPAAGQLPRDGPFRV